MGTCLLNFRPGKWLMDNDIKGRLCFVQFAVGEEREDDKLDGVIALLSKCE
jgi:hypothetical protein